MTEQKIRHFVRIAETDLVGTKPLYMSLTKIHGIGINMAHAICKTLKMDMNTKTGTLSDDQVSVLNDFIKKPTGIPTWQLNRIKDAESGEDTHLVSSKLRLTKDFDLKRMKKNKSYKGMRHSWGLPVRGQRTRANFRKGKTVGVQKKAKAGKKG